MCLNDAFYLGKLRLGSLAVPCSRLLGASKTHALRNSDIAEISKKSIETNTVFLLSLKSVICVH